MSVEGVKSFFKFDGTINLAFIITLVLGLLAVGFQQAQHERSVMDISDHESRIRTLEGQSERLASIETKLSYTTEALARIERRMETK